MSDTKEKEPKKGKGKGPIPIIVGVVVLLVILVIGKSVLGRPAGDKDKKKKKEASHEVGVTVALDEFLVNLNGGGDHYLRASISLGMTKGLTEEQAKEHTAPMRDAILNVLSSKTLKDLASPDGKDKLKDEIMKKVNEATDEETVAKVYFTAFATQ